MAYKGKRLPLAVVGKAWDNRRVSKTDITNESQLVTEGLYDRFVFR
jgi:hypothetical protein